MNPYLLTLVFLLLMSMLTSSEVVKFAQHAIEEELFLHHLAIAEEAQKLEAFGKLEDFKQENRKEKEPEKSVEVVSHEKKAEHKKRPRKSVPLRFNLERPPNNSRLNFYILIQEGRPDPNVISLFSVYETAAELMRTLYTKASFYASGLEYQVLDYLIAQKENVHDFFYPDDLATLEFENAHIQEVFFAMLKGSQDYPSLLDFITFDKPSSSRDAAHKLNLMFTSPVVLKAIFSDVPEIAEKLVVTRNLLWEEILTQESVRETKKKEECKTRSDFKKALVTSFENILESAKLDKESYKKIFDFGLGRYGNILFITNPQTELVTREKYLKRS